MQLRHITLRRGTALKVAHIRALIGNDQCAFKLACVLGIDPEVCGQLHRAAHAGRHINKRAVRKHSRVQRRVVIVRHRHNRAEILFHKLGVVANGF